MYNRQLLDNGYVRDSYFDENGNISHILEYPKQLNTIQINISKNQLLADGVDSVIIEASFYDTFDEKLISPDGLVTFEINGRDISVEIVNGKSELVFKTTIEGEYYVKVKLDGFAPTEQVKLLATI
jgi:hypothetical protein